jgi:hypothetical protein
MSAPYNGADVPGYMLSPGYGGEIHPYEDLVGTYSVYDQTTDLSDGHGGRHDCRPGDSTIILRPGEWEALATEGPRRLKCQDGYAPAVAWPYNVRKVLDYPTNTGVGTETVYMGCRPECRKTGKVGRQLWTQPRGRRGRGRFGRRYGAYGLSPFVPAAAALGGATILALMLVPTFLIGPWAVKQFRPRWPYGKRLVTSFLAGSAIAVTRAAVVGKKDEEEAKLGAMYGAGAIPEGDHAYGGCGTFMRITRDPDKKACLLEKDIARLERKCAKGRKRKCEKLDKKQAELAAIAGSSYAPETLMAATDLQMVQWQQEEQVAATQLAGEQARTQRTLLWVVLAGMSTLVVVGVVRRRS